MELKGRVEIGPYGGASKSGRQHQAFLVTSDGERLMLRRYDGPPMRDAVLEELAGQFVVIEGLRRDDLVIARAITVDSSRPAARPSQSRGGRRGE